MARDPPLAEVRGEGECAWKEAANKELGYGLASYWQSSWALQPMGKQ